MFDKQFLIYVLVTLLVVLSHCHALSNSDLETDSAPSPSLPNVSLAPPSTTTIITTVSSNSPTEDVSLLSNSDLGPDYLPLPENLAWVQNNKNDDFTNVTELDQSASRTDTINGAMNPSGTRPRVAQMTGCRTQGQIAVTYSEGPSDATARIVRHLNNADARANFFFNASWLYTQQYAMVVQNVYNAGHFVGMTYRVKNDDSSLWSDKEIRDDIINNARIIETLIKVSPKYVRLHYTPKPDTRVETILRDLGFVLVGYNLDSQDYSHKDPTGPNSIEDVYRRTFQRQKDTYDAKGSFISIQYDIPDTGALIAVPFMINTINEEGYTMVRLDGCLNDPKPYKKAADSMEYVSDKFSFNSTGYHQGQKAISSEALVVDNWETEEDRMFLKKKSLATDILVDWPYLVMVMVLSFGTMLL
ncbi:uncharacterized protein BX664DRAFT_382456 [Halteromyces radiatus]|uniref:uncharacterized protein n=1 Tax=Halteromyces radiatus TaxID=101107 RepID=UPI00221F4768|nr:uncharacterized protein BX664DRAFT_382456 [Halteromyces radiatus]KAI8100000.1 hypothetical protein BX664DRAFT_382456 [Halteromyces radiatus]